MKKNKIIGYISVAVMSAIGAQVMVEREIDERLKDTEKSNDKETE